MLVACPCLRAAAPSMGPSVTSAIATGYIAAANRAAVLRLMRANGPFIPRRSNSPTKVFTPSQSEVTKAIRIMAAMAQAAREGKGAVSLDGRLIDLASIRMAESLLDKARAAGCLPEGAATPRA